MIQRNDVRFDKNIDLTANINIDNNGLILANKDSNYYILNLIKIITVLIKINHFIK